MKGKIDELVDKINEFDNGTGSISGSVPVTTNGEINHHATALAAAHTHNETLRARNIQLAADINTANQQQGGVGTGRGSDRGRGGRGGRIPTLRVPRPQQPFGVL